MPDAAEAAVPVPAPAPGYSPRQALEDVVGGAFRARRPSRNRSSEPLAWSWQLALVALFGFVSGIDVYLREPFKPADLPADLQGWLPFLNVVGNPLISILVSLAIWILTALGGWVVSLRRFELRRVASGAAFGFWTSTLPVLATIAVGLALGLKSETIAVIIMFLVTAHLIPSIAEACDVSIGRAFGLSFLGPLALVGLVMLGLLGFGFFGKLMGVRF